MRKFYYNPFRAGAFLIREIPDRGKPPQSSLFDYQRTLFLSVYVRTREN
jgi:hypothetical protein